MSAFTGKSVLVTGGANGIGAATVRRAAAAGARVLIADTDAERGADVAAETGAAFQRTDVTDADQVAAAVERAAADHGGLDVLHLNAGVGGPSEGLAAATGVPFDLDEYRTAVAVNLHHIVYGVHAALPHLRGRAGSSIVVTASGAGLYATPSGEIYTATKHAAVGYVRSLALTIEAPPVINAVCPGFVDTPMIAGIRPMLEEMGLGATIMEADEIAAAVERLAGTAESGQAWLVEKGAEPAPFAFPPLPGLPQS